MQDSVGPESLKHIILGPEVDKGHVLSFASPSDTWFTRCVDTEDSGEGNPDYSVISVVLTPAFHPDDVKTMSLRDVLKHGI